MGGRGGKGSRASHRGSANRLLIGYPLPASRAQSCSLSCPPPTAQGVGGAWGAQRLPIWSLPQAAGSPEQRAGIDSASLVSPRLTGVKDSTGGSAERHVCQHQGHAIHQGKPPGIRSFETWTPVSASHLSISGAQREASDLPRPPHLWQLRATCSVCAEDYGQDGEEMTGEGLCLCQDVTQTGTATVPGIITILL